MPKKPISRLLIVGGCGFVGKSLATLLRKNYRVFLMDIEDAIRNHDLNSMEGTDVSKGIFFISGDMTNKSDIEYALSVAKPDLVICLAGYGMSGSSMLDFTKCYNINYHGILNLIEVCKEMDVNRLIYTSTYNVVFGGQRIDHGAESMSYYPVDKHTDGYSASKAEAEKAVLKANNTSTVNGSNFLTAVIRPAGIYGTAEQRHFPRIVRIMDLGLFIFRIGQPVVDWVHIDNLGQAYVRLIDILLNVNCAKKIAKGQRMLYDSPPCGQAYFISDGQPIDMFEFVRPLAEARGVPFPSIIIPPYIMLSLAYTFEMIYHLSKCWEVFGIPAIPPYITRAEVYKSGITHNFSINKAMLELGYQPIISTSQGSLELAAHYRKNWSNEYYFHIPQIIWWVLVIAGMGMLALFSFTDTNYYDTYDQLVSSMTMPAGAVGLCKVFLLAPIAYNYKLSRFLFQSQANLRVIWWLALLSHVLEAIYASYLARYIGCKKTWIAWGVQTFILGYPSLMLLQNREAWTNQVRKIS